MKTNPTGNAISEIATVDMTQPRLPARQADAVVDLGKQPEVIHASLRQALEEASRTAQKLGGELEFSTDRHTGITLVRILDSMTGQLIRQMPSEEALKITRYLDTLQGKLLRQHA
jgi:flagellar protein FlaG